MREHITRRALGPVLGAAAVLAIAAGCSSPVLPQKDEEKPTTVSEAPAKPTKTKRTATPTEEPQASDGGGDGVDDSTYTRQAKANASTFETRRPRTVDEEIAPASTNKTGITVPGILQITDENGAVVEVPDDVARDAMLVALLREPDSDGSTFEVIDCYGGYQPGIPVSAAWGTRVTCDVDVTTKSGDLKQGRVRGEVAGFSTEDVSSIAFKLE